MNTMNALAVVLTAGLAAAPAAHAASFEFNFTYDGATISLDPGSDTPAGTSLSPGDDFVIDVRAAGDAFWRVETFYDTFLPLSFTVAESASRTVDITSTFRLDDVGVGTFDYLNGAQTAFHVGGQEFILPVGFEFDRVTIAWSFLSIDPPGQLTTIVDEPGFFSDLAGPTNGPFFNNPDLVYVDPQVIPLPASMPLVLGGLAALGLVSRRRRKAA